MILYQFIVTLYATCKLWTECDKSQVTGLQEVHLFSSSFGFHYLCT